MPMSLSSLLPSFETELQAAGKSPNTITVYTASVRMFALWAAERGTEPDTGALTREAIRDWIAGLQKTRAQATVLARFIGLNVFTKWAAAEGEIPADPMATLKRPDQPEPPPVPVLADDELAKLIATAKTRPTEFHRRRDEALIRVFYDCGVRRGELTGMALDDVDFAQQVIRVTGKGGKVRSVPFGIRTARGLDRYIRARRSHRYADEPGLWLGRNGVLTAKGVEEAVNALGRDAGIEDLHAHRFRHSFSHQFLADGGQERDLMRLNGWSSPVMLGRYGASLADQRAREAHRRRSPGDRLK